MFHPPRAAEPVVTRRGDAASRAATDARVPAAATSARKAAPPQVRGETLCAKDVKIAPIFLRKTQHGESKRSGDGRPGRPAEKLREPARPPQTEGVQRVKGQRCLSTVCRPTESRGSWGGRLSPSALRGCLDDIRTSNPAFPVTTVFSSLRERARGRPQDVGPAAISSPQNPFQEKRKRGNDSSDRGPKRLRSSLAAEETFNRAPCLVPAVQEGPLVTVQQQQQQQHQHQHHQLPGSNKLSRTRRLREQSGSPAGPEPLSGSIHLTESRGQSAKTSGIPQRGELVMCCLFVDMFWALLESRKFTLFCPDPSLEDVLWTDKYSPRSSREVIGNSAPVKKLQTWLKKWKLRADRDERRQMDERRREGNSNNSWDCGDFQGEAGPEEEPPPGSTVLITGPPGVGKTASVYACAQELGFKVFEVNCSSQRSGRHVLSQLKEATQSHLVETSGKDPLKPTYFNNYAINGCTARSETLPGKAARPKNVTSTSKSRAGQKSGPSRRGGKPCPAAVTLANYFRVKARADHVHAGGPAAPDGSGSDPTVAKNRKTATSLILFEEVDVIFDDDVGFLAAVKTFMATAKRPVVLTTSDPSFRERFNCSVEEIVFKTPSVVDVCSYLQLVGLAEDVRLESDDVSSLLRLTGGDARRCLLQLQLWVSGGAGQVYSGDPGRGDDEDSQQPRWDAGCTASMLGLHHMTRHQLSNLLKRPVWSEMDMKELLALLAESWRGGVPLLYANLELLLPTAGAEGTRPAPSDGDPRTSRSVKKASRLGRRKRIPATRDAASSGGLDALADFFDLVSYLDSTTPAAAAAASLISGPCRPEAFVWTGAEIKDGLLDEMRDEEEEEEEEVGRTLSLERLLDIQAAVEGLAGHRCCRRMSEAQKYRLELGDAQRGAEGLTSPQRRSLTFSAHPPCSPSVSRRRYELSRAILGRSPFSLLGNRRAESEVPQRHPAGPLKVNGSTPGPGFILKNLMCYFTVLQC
ncbi:ATPase family AAA domain-containing protein 5b isoform X2 [Clinocottus analis]|uniref:ATPase family AAA domain-containing protein 5b isoform X2 n=1 Tax=Clinocottus analis TaxID=304258 RepID=UPI0035BF7180